MAGVIWRGFIGSSVIRYLGSDILIDRYNYANGYLFGGIVLKIRSEILLEVLEKDHWRYVVLGILEQDSWEVIE